MQERFPAVYTPASLADYPLKQRLAIRLAAFAFYILIKLIGYTLRYEVDGEDPRPRIREAGKTPIFAIWHNRIFASIYFMRGDGIVVLTSKSFDGEYIARFLTKFGFGSVRGSSSRGGVRGMVEMIRLIRAGLPMAFTVDGPRGPRYEAKSGPVVLAKKTGNPILSFVVECERFWQVKSWDRLQIPKPFSRARVFYAEPVSVPEDADDDVIEEKRSELQAKLNEAVERGRRWRSS
jgi:lysophospholipid acyltransferase (LPLAT)-like uncharacterized protein